jgi:hypothetical protein
MGIMLRVRVRIILSETLFYVYLIYVYLIGIVRIPTTQSDKIHYVNF